MKKFFACLTAAAAILTIASCSNEPAETTTTTAAETTLAPAETTPEETDAPEETTANTPDETETETEEETPAENGDPMEILRANVPIYANYLEEQTILPIRVGFAYETDLYGTGVLSACTMDTIIKSTEEMAVITTADGAEQSVVITKDRYYMVSPAEKTALYMEIDDSMRAELEESMSAGLDSGVLFDAASAVYETGTEEYNGAEYLFEKITSPEMEATVYADPATGKIRYLISEGIEMEITALTHDVDDSIFVIPDDYTLVDMADAFGAE